MAFLNNIKVSICTVLDIFLHLCVCVYTCNMFKKLALLSPSDEPKRLEPLHKANIKPWTNGPN